MKDFDKIGYNMGALDKSIRAKMTDRFYDCPKCHKICPNTAILCWNCGANLVKETLKQKGDNV